jgi:hypothetical protein
VKKDGDLKPPVQEMNRAFWIVLGPTALVAIGYVLVFRAMGMEPGYWKLAGVLVLLALGLWWIGRKDHKRTTPL